MSNHPIPPPTYGSTSPSPRSPNAPLYTPTRYRDEPGPSVGIYNQPAPGDLPDDFKYGVTVTESSIEIRNAFVRKVYTILFAQILATTIVGGLLSQSRSAVFWVQTHIWSFYVPLFGTFIVLGLLYWKRHTHPLNIGLLAVFTLMEAFTLGVVTAFYDNVIVLQALLITTGVFLGLTLFTLQSKYDFSGMGPWLFAGLLALLMTGFVGVFIPFNSTLNLIYAIGGTLLFSGYIVYDTYLINSRLSPDEYIMGAISLYLDFINLFLNILRLLSNMQDR
ncbi:UPF0005-domain-containing protein [Multifurca ochricompacta]|uniref:UPF0005-domain-containing protein n=1 Tax=Multifurca ochricompacta TaxID=376703 RepID=A0AAD4QR01_9AGAM|nr:UPF0005-domain-containing protein [Multifurca ochricompacta]